MSNLRVSEDVSLDIRSNGEVEILTLDPDTWITNSIVMSIEEAIQLADIIKACVPN